MPLAQKLPGLRKYSYGPTRALDGGEGPFFWMFIGTFDSLKAINDALASPGGAKSRRRHSELLSRNADHPSPGFDGRLRRRALASDLSHLADRWPTELYG